MIGSLGKINSEVAMLATQLATARDALQKIADLPIASGEDALSLLQEAQRIADEGLREAGLAPQ